MCNIRMKYLLSVWSKSYRIMLTEFGFQFPTLKTSTIVLASATLIGAFVGALANIWYNLKKRKWRRNRLRESLFTEIDNHKFPSEDFPSEAHKFPPLWGSLLTSTPTTIYESVGDDIALLSDEEAQLIVAFYSLEDFVKQFAISQERNLENIREDYEETYEILYEFIGDEKELSADDLATLLETHESFEKMLKDIQNSETLEKLLMTTVLLREQAKYKLKEQHPEWEADVDISLSEEAIKTIEENFDIRTKENANSE